MQDRKKGIFYIICAAFFFALMNMFVRASGDLPSIQKSFFRNIVALFLAVLSMRQKKVPFRWKKENFGYLLTRAFFGTVGILCNFYAVDHLVLSDASMLNKMSPFFAVVFSTWLLKEKVTLPQGLFVTGAFLGSLLVIKPTFDNMALMPSLIGLLGGMSAGLAYTCVRKVTLGGENGAMVVAFFSGFSCLVTLPFLIFSFHPMTLKQFCILMLAGAAAAGGQFSITAAYSHAPAREISIYDYTQILFAALMGLAAFGQLPDLLSVAGYGVILVMAVGMFIYNQKKDAVA